LTLVLMKLKAIVRQMKWQSGLTSVANFNKKDLEK